MNSHFSPFKWPTMRLLPFLAMVLVATLANTAAAQPPPPTTPVLNPADDSGFRDDDMITKVQTPRFSGLTQGDAIVRLVSDLDGIVGTTTTPGNDTDPDEPWQITTSTLTEGTHIIHATAEDGLGNVSDPSTTVTLVIDITPPAQPPPPILPTIFDSGEFNNDQITNVTSPTLVGLAEPNSFVEILENGNNIGGGLADGSGNYAISVGFPVDGVYPVTARAIDVAGNIGPNSDPLVIEIDTTPPPPPTVNLDPASDSGRFDTDHITNVTTPTLNGLAEADSLIEIYANGILVGTTRTLPDSTWTTRTVELADGVYTITVTATDVAGNTSDPGVLVPDLVIDTTPPAPPSVPNLLAADDSGRSDSDNITNVTTPRFDGTTEPDARVTISAAGVDLGTAIADSSGNYLVQVDSPLPDGIHEIVIRAEDLAGNVGGNSAPLLLEIDTTPPPAPSIPNLLAADDSGRSNNDNVTTFTMPRFDGTSEQFAYIELVDLLAPGQPVIGAGAPDDAGPDGEWLVQVTTPLADGDYFIAARAEDIAGNVGPLSDFLLVTIDTTPPAPPILAGLANESPVLPGCSVDNLTSGTTPIIVGTAEDAAFIRFFDVETGLQVGFGASVGGNFTIGTTSFPEGTHSVIADATDVAGNISDPSDPFTFTIDTTPPDVILVDDDPDTGTPHWRVAQSIPVRLLDLSSASGLSDTEPVRLYVRHEYFDPVVSNAWELVGTFNGDDVIDYTPAFGRGRYFFHVTAMDCAGNTTGIPQGNSGEGMARTIYNPVPNSRLVLEVPAGTTEVFPMTSTTRVYIDYTGATPQGFVSVERHDDIPFGFESTVFIKESLNIQGAFDGAATLTWHYDPSSPEDLVKPIDRVYRFEGGTRTLYPGAPGSTAFFQRDEHWLRVTGVDSFSWWYAGNDPAITTIEDWNLY